MEQPYGLEHLPDPDLISDLEQLAIELAVRAGSFILAERPGGLAVASTKSTDLDVVTAMDTGSEDRLRDRLAQIRPEDAVLGEEDGLSGGSSGLTWVLDPIDGTVNYLYDQPAYAVSVAVVVGDPRVDGGWRTIAAAVINPRVAEVFHARLGGGAHLRLLARDGTGQLGHPGEPRPLRTVVPADLATALVGTGFSYDRQRRVEQGRVAAQLLLEVRDLRRMGAAALDLCAVAAGRLDGYYEAGLKVWDLAGGVLIVTEAGGRVSGLDGTTAAPGEHMVIAAGEPFFTRFHTAIAGLHDTSGHQPSH